MKLEGEIGEINVIERLVELGRGGFTGAVRFENDGIIKIIYFKNGDVLSASTNDRTDSVDEILLRANKVTREHVKQALAKRKENETLGDALLGLGFITRKELSWARRVQVIGAIRSVSEWKSGSFNIVADYLPKREEGTIFPLTQVIVELVVTDNDRQKFDRALDGGNVVLDRGHDFDEQFARLSLNEEAEQIVGAVDGERNAAEVALASGKDAFNVYKLLHALETVGVLVRKEAQASPELSIDAPAEDFGAFPAGTNAVPDSWMASEPQPASSGFSWDTEQETPVMSHSAFDDTPAIPPAQEPLLPPSHEPEFEPESVATTPLWSAPAPINTAVPPPPLTPREPQWGFDEAQIETARRAAVPLSSAGADDPPPMSEVVERASKPNRWIGALIAAVVIVAIAFAALAGWNWWQKQNEQPAPVVVQRPKRIKPLAVPAAVPATQTTASATTATTGTTGTVAVSSAALTTTTAPAPQPTGSMTTATSAPASLTKPTTHPPPPATPPQQPALSKVVAKRSPAGAVTITSTAPSAAASPAANDAMRSHYDEMAHTFASQATGSYTIQFELVCQTASLTRAVQEGGSNVWFVPTTHKGQSCYRVFWGHYPTKADAQKAKTEVPKSLGASGVVVAVPK
jgi:septal ring-binding cell division protein DamX